MRNQARRRSPFDIAIHAVLLIAVALGVGSSTLAGDGKWKVQLEPMVVSVYGHDQHVLNVQEIDFGPPAVDETTAVTLDVESSFAMRASLQRTFNQWGYGIDYFTLITSQKANSLTAAADGTIDEVILRAAGRSYASTDSSEVLFYDVLTDTDLAMWTVDLYATRVLADKPNSGIDLQLGVRLGDFDNDYFAVFGEQDVAGTFVGASSNYSRLTGPLVGLTGEIRRGKNSVRGYIGQSLLIGSATVFNSYDDFTGSVDAPTIVAQESFVKDLDVGIPITEFRLKWTYTLTKHVALGLGANTSVWWDVAVPPGVIPTGSTTDFHENTVVLFGLVGAVDLTF
jgi:hypothetical protein